MASHLSQLHRKNNADPEHQRHANAASVKACRVSKWLEQIKLPRDLIRMIRKGTLEAEIEKAYARYDALNAVIDAWEEQNPGLVPQLPWYEGREAWKAAGRPRPPWYQVLGFMTRKLHPIKVWDIWNDLLNLHC